MLVTRAKININIRRFRNPIWFCNVLRHSILRNLRAQQYLYSLPNNAPKSLGITQKRGAGGRGKEAVEKKESMQNLHFMSCTTSVCVDCITFTPLTWKYRSQLWNSASKLSRIAAQTISGNSKFITTRIATRWQLQFTKTPWILKFACSRNPLFFFFSFH